MLETQTQLSEAQKLAELLKGLGYTRKHVSVKDNGGSHNWSLTMTIRDSSVIFSKVENLKKEFTQYSTCEASGEILSGGNTFVSIQITEEVREAWTAKHLDVVKNAMEVCKQLVQGVEINERFNVHFLDGNFRLTDNGNFLPMNYRSAESIALDIFKLEQKPYTQGTPITVYMVSEFMGNVVKREGTYMSHGVNKYAQYSLVPFLAFITKGKRSVTSIRSSGYKPYMLILEGVGHPEPDDMFNDAVDKGEVTIRTSRYASFDERYITDFEAVMDKHLAKRQHAIIADYRFTKGYSSI